MTDDETDRLAAEAVCVGRRGDPDTTAFEARLNTLSTRELGAVLAMTAIIAADLATMAAESRDGVAPVDLVEQCAARYRS
jgi:hypothetical protein